MRKPEQAPEPSIEEILASIRRIIADDVPPAAPAVEAEAPSRLRARPGVPRLRAADETGRAGAGRSEDEVFELTEDYMLAEEAPAVQLQEPEEPAELSADVSYDDPFATKSDADPYDDGTTVSEHERQRDAPVHAATPEPAPSNGLASVMAEVQRFVTGKSAEAQKPEPKPAESPSQPQQDAFKSDFAPRAASRWSARQPAAEPGKGPEPLPSSRSGQAPLPQHRASRLSACAIAGARACRCRCPMKVRRCRSRRRRSPNFHLHRLLRRSRRPLRLPLPQRRPSLRRPASRTRSRRRPPRSTSRPRVDAQSRMEKLADQVVADFASDKFAEVPVAGFIKTDRPLMEEITGTLANALAQAGDEPREFEDASTPPDVMADDSGPDLPNSSLDERMAPDFASGAPIPGLGGGFAGTQPVPPRASQMEPPASADLDSPELPREEPDDLFAALHPDHMHRSTAYQPSGIAEFMSMPQTPAAPGRMMSRPSSSMGMPRGSEFDRLQAASGPKSLEDTVREMLRPLLVQWLNEHMPRILNDALREEMASAGFLRQKLENERR